MASRSLPPPQGRDSRRLPHIGPWSAPTPRWGLGLGQVHDWGSGCHWEVWGLCTFHVDYSEAHPHPHPPTPQNPVADRTHYSVEVF